MKASLNQIIGFDEVGRGPLAGPVVVACVFSQDKIVIPKDIIIRDSKKMTIKQREKANDWIINNFKYGLGEVNALEIDQKGINNAIRFAAHLALESLKQKTNINFNQVKLLIDGRDEWLKGSQAIIGGDNLIPEISMAAIIAKVYRDSFMKELAIKYPDYGFEKHVGYGTALHIEMIKKMGLIKNIHRKTFCRGFNNFVFSDKPIYNQ